MGRPSRPTIFVRKNGTFWALKNCGSKRPKTAFAALTLAALLAALTQCPIRVIQ